ncbi:MAG: chemotaxis protein CheW [Endozoicomonas sp.]
MDAAKTIATLLIPMQQKPLLVPEACIAEIVDYRRPVPGQLKASWCLGNIGWRGLEIPLISFEKLNQGRFADFSATARIAIMNNTSGNPEMPFYAVVIQGLPQPIPATVDDVKSATADAGPAEMARVLVREIPAAIPNLSLVEQELAKEII